MTERDPDQEPVVPVAGPDPAVAAEPLTTEADAEPLPRVRVDLNPSVAAPAEPVAPFAATAVEPPVPTIVGEATTAPTPATADRASSGPRPYAVIETGGKQYRVSVGDRISVEKLPIETGTELTIDKVYLLGGDGSTRVGTPTVPGATVTARVDDQFRGEKLVIFKYKAKKRYRRRTGHRQSLTALTITNIAG
jgi:large subunit ribosomal protein L21